MCYYKLIVFATFFAFTSLAKAITVVTPPDEVDDWIDSYSAVVNTQQGPKAHVQAYSYSVTLVDDCNGNPTLAWPWTSWVATLGSWPTTFSIYGPLGGLPAPALGESETYYRYYDYDQEWYLEWWPSAMRDRVTDTFTGQHQIIVG